MKQLIHDFCYAKVRLALEAWKLKHGEYPQELDELAEGDDPLLKIVPCSIYSGRQFAYSGEGLDAASFFVPEPVRSLGQIDVQFQFGQHEQSVLTSEIWIESGQPFLLPWSGVAAEKKAFLRQEIQVEGEAAVYSNAPESAYWIPVGHAYWYQINGVENFLLDTEKPGSEEKN